VVVTISREYGAGGIAVADGVAIALGYELFDDESLSRAVAARLGTSPAAISDRATKAPLGERILEQLGTGMLDTPSPATPRLPGDFDEDVRREIERTIRDRAGAGRAVILGRNAGIVLGAQPGVLRVFLIAERGWRVERLSEYFGQSRERALADLARVDGARKKFAKDRYELSWGDPHLYDLVLDVSRLGISGAVALVVAAVRAWERS